MGYGLWEYGISGIWVRKVLTVAKDGFEYADKIIRFINYILSTNGKAIQL